MKRKKQRTSSPRKVGAAINRVRKFHDLGCKLLERYPDRNYRKRAMVKEGKRRRQSRTMVTWARLFARLYTSSELEELFTLCSERVVPLRKSHIIHLLQVPIAKERRRLQREVIMKGWSTTELGRYITSHYGRRGGGGRRQDIPTDVVGLLSQVEAMCDTWQRFKDQVNGKRLPGAVRKQFNKATQLIDGLEDTVGRAIKRRKPDRVTRKTRREAAR